MIAPEGVQLLALKQFALVSPGQALLPLIVTSLDKSQLTLRDGDVLVLAQKVVSKAENRYVQLADVSVSSRAKVLAQQCQKDPRLVELILRESERVVRCQPGVLIVRHKLGFVHANAGIDHSNIPCGDEQVLLLPQDPDASAAELSRQLSRAYSAQVAVVINDSFGRAWRQGTSGVCIGASGLRVLDDQCGNDDLFGQPLQATQVALGDEIAAAASLLMGAADEACPVVLVRGLSVEGQGAAEDLLRPAETDLFLSDASQSDASLSDGFLSEASLSEAQCVDGEG